MQRAPVLAIRAMGKRFRAGVPGCWATVRSLVDVHLDIWEGEVVALVGVDGAGKTTLLRCAAGLLVPDEGLVERCRGADGRLSVVRYFSGCVQARRAAIGGETWDLGLIDDVDRLHRDALVPFVTGARCRGTSLLLAARDATVVREVSDRTLTLERGCLADACVAGRAVIARVAEQTLR